MIKNIWTIYKEDLKRIFKNYAALIVVLTLCILPSLYAWFNIKASWDPYGQEATSQIKIGVINNDDGSEFNGSVINIGDKIIESLEENDVLGWEFVDEETGETALEEGEFYATITIPHEFSQDILSLVTSDVKKGQIIYRVNEKINAIAPKLTSKGATGVQENINQTIVETVSGILLETGKELGFEIQETVLPELAHVYTQLEGLISKFGDMNSLVQTAHNGGIQLKDLIASIQKDLPLIESTITSAQTTTSSLEDFMNLSKEALNDFTPTLKNDLLFIQSIANDLDHYAVQLEELILSGSEKAPEFIANLVTKVESTQGLIDTFINVLNTFNKFPVGRFDEQIAQLEGVKDELSKVITFLQQMHETIVNGGEPDLTVLTNIQTLLSDVSSTADAVYNRFDAVIAPALDEVIDQAYQTTAKVLQLLNEAQAKLPDVESLLSTAYEGADKGIDAIEYINSKLPEAEDKVHEVAKKLSEINESQSLKEVLDLIQEAVTERQNFMASPVDLVEEILFPMNNYGTAMTPFYSVLAQWVGMTLLISMLSVHAKGEYRPTEEYFGKLLLFVSIALVQGLVIALGDLYLLNIYCVNPLLFVLGILFTSVTFTAIVYSLVSVFGNIGKVTSIILLVLQVAGSGGTFPIQLTPKFFQMIHPFLPFTYAISFAREAIGGVVESVLIKDITVMCTYIIVALLISIFFKKPINQLLHGFAKKFEESGLGE
ncbi:MAG: YhgE/Pip domain-containing protein [Turicibacter sp.]|nr:YhgE/Pip domain-containing protein [Turicibacter sp.]